MDVPKEFKIPECSDLAHNTNLFSLSLNSVSTDYQRKNSSSLAYQLKILKIEMGQHSFINKSLLSFLGMPHKVYFDDSSLAHSSCAQIPVPGHHSVQAQDCCAYLIPWVAHNGCFTTTALQH